MGDPDRRVRFINMLAAGSAGTIGIDLEVFIKDLNIDIIRKFRENKN